MTKVVVGMSGGVDSAVTAYLLKEAGYEVVGLTLRTWESEDGEESRCCEIDDASDSARKIGIDYHTLNCLGEFRDGVVEPFINNYIDGLTPNPCVICNRRIKWERLMYFAKVVKADYVATGHFANVIKLPNGRFTVKQADMKAKDQTYMLYRLTQEDLAHTLMPLGSKSKEDVREIARSIGLSVATKKDSEDICFVPDGDYSNFIEKERSEGVPGEGNFVDEDGNVLGRHKGIIHYTVGQRRGLGLAMGYHVFVKEIKADTNEIVVTTLDSLYSKVIRARDVNYMGLEPLDKGKKAEALVKVRYHHEMQKATIEADTGSSVIITFDEPVKAASPGQSAVFYDDDGCVLGGGVISK